MEGRAQVPRPTPQQILIVENILRGKQDKDIAEALGLSVPTVRTYLKRIFDQLQVSDRLTRVLHVFAKAQKIGRHGDSRHH